MESAKFDRRGILGMTAGAAGALALPAFARATTDPVADYRTPYK